MCLHSLQRHYVLTNACQQKKESCCFNFILQPLKQLEAICRRLLLYKLLSPRCRLLYRCYHMSVHLHIRHMTCFTFRKAGLLMRLSRSGALPFMVNL